MATEREKLKEKRALEREAKQEAAIRRLGELAVKVGLDQFDHRLVAEQFQLTFRRLYTQALYERTPINYL